jgi:hypothetical protein
VAEKLVGYTDADFAACYSRRSRSGYVFFVGSNVISWSSRKQASIALSTCESEYYALTEGAKEALYLKKLLWEVTNQMPYQDDLTLEPVKVFCDNQSTIFVVKNSTLGPDHKMMKHVDVRFKWIQEKVCKNELEISYVSTKDQFADVFTKALAKVQHDKLCSYIIFPCGGVAC